MKLVVVGGVAGGASAAARVRRLDEHADIVVLERDGYVSYANCGLPYHIGGVIQEREKLLVQTPESLKRSLNLDVRVGHEVTAIDREHKQAIVREVDSRKEYRESYDKLVLAQGARPIRPNLPGIEHPRILALRNIPDMDRIIATLAQGTRRALVIGGGYIGVEVAENFRHLGLDVELVEMMRQVMPPIDHEMARDLEYHLEANGVRLHLGSAAEGFSALGDGLAIRLSSGETLEADLVVLAVGVRPDTRLADKAGLPIGPGGGVRTDAHMRTTDPDIYAVGDMVEVTDTITGEAALVSLAGPANRQGRVAADHICGRDSVYRSTQGTAVLKVFDMVGGGTGASERSLNRSGMAYRKVYLHPSGHASYYPGTAPMHIKILFEPDGGRLLGAQVVGFDGVDKRLDVFATAIRAGLTVYDLEHLELAYAPPFGSAKDPVNMAGFLASNLLRGDHRFWYAEDYPMRTNEGTLVDVRTEIEYTEWHIPGAVNIPLGELRQRVGELPTHKPLFVYCRVGFRGYLAYRILVQRGFGHVCNLAGGSLTFSSYHRTVYSTGEATYPFVAHAEDEIAEKALAVGLEVSP